MDQNGWWWMKVDGDGWRWMVMDVNGWKWTKMDGDGWKWMVLMYIHPPPSIFVPHNIVVHTPQQRTSFIMSKIYLYLWRIVWVPVTDKLFLLNLFLVQMICDLYFIERVIICNSGTPTLRAQAALFLWHSLPWQQKTGGPASTFPPSR